MLAKPSTIQIFAPLYQFKILLMSSDPPIWRRVAAHSDITLRDFHAVLQTVMGWQDRYSHVFEVAGVRYTPTTGGWPPKPILLSGWPYFLLASFFHCIFVGLLRVLPAAIDERKLKLRSLFSEIGAQFTYEYPATSGWKYQITLESFLPNSRRAFDSPVCIAGEGAWPPEKCLALAAFEGHLPILREKQHPQRRELTEWCYDDFDSTTFDIDFINAQLRQHQQCSTPTVLRCRS